MAETEKKKKLHKELIRQMVTLSTAGFGLVAALAWNDAVQQFVKDYLDKYLPDGSGFLSRLIYAVLITCIAVFVTYELSKLSRED